MALQLYSQAEVYLNGGKLAEQANVSVTRRTNAQPMSTLSRGFAGMCPGAATIEVRITNAVPAANFELNPGPFMGMNATDRALQVAELYVFAAGRAFFTKGFITEDNFTHAVDSASRLEFTMICDPQDWSTSQYLGA